MFLYKIFRPKKHKPGTTGIKVLKFSVFMCDFCNKIYEISGARKRYFIFKKTFCNQQCYIAFQQNEAATFFKVKEIKNCLLENDIVISNDTISNEKNIIYVLQNKINKKCYVGKSTVCLATRWNRHIKNSAEGKYAINKTIRKYGPENFDVFCLEIVGNKKQLAEREVFWIKKLGTFDYGYNMTKGGEGSVGHKLSKEHKEKISKANKGKIVSDETKRRQSIAKKGKCSRKTFIFSKETIEKMRKAALNKDYTSDSYINGIKKATEKRKKPVIQMDLDGNIIKIWSCAKEVEETIKVFATTIAAVCKGKKKTTGGFKWKYLERAE